MRLKTMEKQRDLSDPLTMRLPREVLEDIETIAGAFERSRSWVIVRALKAYLAAEGREVLDIVQARADLAAGGGVDADELLEELEAIVKGQAA
jgi:predicted transcriptional regulator